ncbi:MAG: 50S ribosomal protein L17 [Nitrospirota bacterium]|nr:50S ribosomal protein L17 [Nitrospirota bacterium]
MKHRIAHRKLGRNTSHRLALLRNLLRSLILHGKIQTTHEKAREAGRLFDRMVGRAKKGDLASVRLIARVLVERDIVRRLVAEIAPKMQTRSSGFTRIIKIGFRRGDGAGVSILEIVE